MVCLVFVENSKNMKKKKQRIPRTSKHIGNVARGNVNPIMRDVIGNGLPPIELREYLKIVDGNRAERRANGHRGKKK